MSHEEQRKLLPYSDLVTSTPSGTPSTRAFHPFACESRAAPVIMSRNARCIWATPAFKSCIRGFRHCLSISWLQKSSASDSWRCNPAPWETVIMNPRLAAMAALCREVAIPASVLAWIAAFGSAGIDNTGAAPIVERPAPSLTAVARFADKLPPISLGAADAVAASRSVTETAAAEATPASHRAGTDRYSRVDGFIGNAAARNIAGAGGEMSWRLGSPATLIRLSTPPKFSMSASS